MPSSALETGDRVVIFRPQRNSSLGARAFRPHQGAWKQHPVGYRSGEPVEWVALDDAWRASTERGLDVVCFWLDLETATRLAALSPCNMLAYWTGGNRERVERLFAESGWPEKSARAVEGTIDKAM